MQNQHTGKLQSALLLEEIPPPSPLRAPGCTKNSTSGLEGASPQATELQFPQELHRAMEWFGFGFKIIQFHGQPWQGHLPRSQGAPSPIQTSLGHFQGSPNLPPFSFPPSPRPACANRAASAIKSLKFTQNSGEAPVAYLKLGNVINFPYLYSGQEGRFILPRCISLHFSGAWLRNRGRQPGNIHSSRAELGKTPGKPLWVWFPCLRG